MYGNYQSFQTVSNGGENFSGHLRFCAVLFLHRKTPHRSTSSLFPPNSITRSALQPIRTQPQELGILLCVNLRNLLAVIPCKQMWSSHICDLPVSDNGMKARLKSLATWNTLTALPDWRLVAWEFSYVPVCGFFLHLLTSFLYSTLTLSVSFHPSSVSSLTMYNSSFPSDLLTFSSPVFLPEFTIFLMEFLLYFSSLPPTLCVLPQFLSHK